MTMMMMSLTTSLPYPFQILLVFILSIASITLLGRILSRPTKTKDRSRQLPPGPPGWPILGNLPELMKTRPRHKYFEIATKGQKPEIACFNFAGTHTIIINSDEIAREAFKERDADFADRPNTFNMRTIGGNHKSMGNTPTGEQFMKMKRVITSEIMSVKTLNMLVAARNIEADNLLAYLLSIYKRSETADVREISRNYGYAVTMRMMFGRRHVTKENVFSDEGRLGPAEKDHLDAIFETLNCLPSFSPADYLEKWFLGWNVDGLEERVTVNCNKVRSYNNPIIDERHYKKTRHLQGNMTLQFRCKSLIATDLQAYTFPRKSLVANRNWSQNARKFATDILSSQICKGTITVANLQRKISPRNFASVLRVTFSSHICKEIFPRKIASFHRINIFVIINIFVSIGMSLSLDGGEFVIVDWELVKFDWL